MSPATAPRLLLVEDDPALGPLLVELLADGFAAELAVDGPSGLQQGLTGQWDVMVIDRGLPGIDGIRLVSALRGHGIDTPILILTALGAVADKVEGLDAGANDYLVKPFDIDELSARLRALTRNGKPGASRKPAGPLAVGSWELAEASRVLTSPYGDRVELSPAETRLLAILAAEPGRVFTRAELLELAFAAEDGPGIVDTYVHHLRKKTARSVIRTVHGTGYHLGGLE
ncbi:response regulator transcription factor [Arthrobacter sp. JSM 101049]|uniref:response regulator transcription factor n=1 Tax=Arthrobacter sp. JSM 101049 TaxID=929097 RepID=UPI00356902D6